MGGNRARPRARGRRVRGVEGIGLMGPIGLIRRTSVALVL